ncbi:MAG TPA: beta-1,3-glucanase family protein [Chitinivibrionales bacterium]|jgi:hypothetical protein|nr:beta-1,3-glucanase family protein [Chitinivibrionales bacterium]
MRKAAVLCAILAFFPGAVFSQMVGLYGIITDEGGTPLTHTVVRLSQTTYNNGFCQAPYMVTTDAYGHYVLGAYCGCGNVNPKNPVARTAACLRPLCIGGKVIFSVPSDDALVRMSMYDLSGKLVRDLMNKSLPRSTYSASIDTRGISAQPYLLRLIVNGTSSVMRLQPGLRSQGGEITASDPAPQTRLEKLAAAVDTLRATEPGYTLGVTPVTLLVGSYDFVLKKNNTWDGDENAFWGDTGSYPRSGPTLVVLNRTNGAFPDSEIFWSNGPNGEKIPITRQDTCRVTISGRFYIWVAPSDSNNRYFDIIEQMPYGTLGWAGNTTRVEGWRLPIAFRVHYSTGGDTVIGDSYWMFRQTRQSKFDEFVNEVPREFTGLATQGSAAIWAPYTSPVNYFDTGGPYADYFLAYEDSVIAHNPDAPAKTTSWNIFACASPLSSSPFFCGAYNRHVGTLPRGNQFFNWDILDTASYYKDSPCNYYSKWCHRRSINNLCYGFPYDDAGGHEAWVEVVKDVQWIAVAIGW